MFMQSARFDYCIQILLLKFCVFMLWRNFQQKELKIINAVLVVCGL